MSRQVGSQVMVMEKRLEEVSRSEMYFVGKAYGLWY